MIITFRRSFKQDMLWLHDYYLEVLVFFIKFILLTLSRSLFFFFISFIIDYGVAASILFFFYSREKRSSWKFSIKTAHKLLSESWALILSGFIVLIYMRTDQVMLNHLLGGHAVGIYSAGVKIVEVFYVLPLVLNPSILPTMIKGNDDKVKSLLSYYSVFLIWSGVGLFIFNFFWGKGIVSLLFGHRYLDSFEIVKVLMLNCIFVFFSYSRGLINLKYSLFKFDTIYLFISALVNIFLNFVFIPKYGILGAAYASLLAQFSGNILFPLFHSKTRFQTKLFFRSIFFKRMH